MPVKIMLDPGHAGNYFNQSPVVPTYYESAAMWELCKKLKAALERRGFIVGVTRQTKGEDPELTERGMKARGYDLFLSLHSNASSSAVPDAPWLIHFVEDAKTELDDASEAVAHALGGVISRVMGVSAPYYYTKSTDFDRNRNGAIDDEWYGVLFGAKEAGVPGVIIEHSFHTNKHAATWLSADANLERLAEAEADALAEFYEIEDMPMTADERKAFDALSDRVDQISDDVENVKPKYDWTLACPEWAQCTVHKLHHHGILKGDENGQLRLSDDMCRLLVILDRAGVFGV